MHYHFIGIGGIGMSALAQILLKRGEKVFGSDSEVNGRTQALVQAGAYIYKGQLASQVSPNSIVVYSSDIKTENPEYQAAIEKKCKLLHRADLLATLIHEQKSLAVAGTHGKTTTSALLSTVLQEANYEPTFAIGGILIASNENFGLGSSDYFVLEADESDCSFLKYSPYGAIITNIDFDHLINYQNDFQQLKRAFQKFIAQVRCEKHLFWCGDDKELSSMNLKGASYGFSSHCDWKISRVSQQGFCTSFDLRYKDSTYSNIILNAVGHHNVLNAAAVFALSLSLGILECSIRLSLSNFKGIKRRCEQKGRINDILFIDDYAHHPTEITTTLKGIKNAIANKNLVVLFQPHRYSRTLECLHQYQECFDLADQVIVTDIYSAGEQPIAHLSGKSVAFEIQKKHSCCHYISRAALAHHFSQTLLQNQVLVTLGAGDITLVSQETISLLDKQTI